MGETTGLRARDLDVAGLRRRLEATVRGDVAFDAGVRALYTMDASNYRCVPLGVVAPADTDDVEAAVAACREFGAPITPRGGGTSIGGQAVGTGVVLDTARHLTRILDIDPDRRLARVEPGVILDDLQAAASGHRLLFGPDPSTHSRCTLGGMIGNNSCGAHSVAWGKTADNVEELDVLLYDGTRLALRATPRAELDRLAARPDRAGQIHAALRDLTDANLALLRTGLPEMPRRVSGYALEHLLPENGRQIARALVGTEGTCVVVLGATLRLVERPAGRALVVLGYPDDVAAAEAVPELLPFYPLTVESLSAELVALSTVAGERVVGRRRLDLPDGGAWLLVEVGADSVAAACDHARDLAQVMVHSTGSPTIRVLGDPGDQRRLWRIREEAAGLATRMADGAEAWPGWEDVAVPPERLGDYLRRFRALLARHGLRGLPYGHFGEGCVHVRIDFDLISPRGVAAFRAFSEELADLVVACGGSLSGEHGDGQARAEFLPRLYGPEMVRLFEQFKGIFDPGDLMNPGIVIRPRRIDDNLRFAALPVTPVPPRGGVRPSGPPGAALAGFTYPHDRGDFAQALRRCVGVGKCRNTSTEGGTVMCPSYLVTREEKHSTRGRARLLYEMLAGEVVTGGWRAPEVAEALDLCLSCKGCRSDCPVSVDMATYKAEFLHNHYARRLRPASHYSMGWLPLWARMATLAPTPAAAANALGSSGRTGPALRRLAGVTPERTLPRFAAESFTRWFARHRGQAELRARSGFGDPQMRPPVLLWPDTFTNAFSPGVGQAAVTVLESAGFTVLLPRRPVCCGLTWVSTGQLGIARRVMRRTLTTLEPVLAAGIPVVGLEPSCTAALRGDLPELLGVDVRARKLADATFTLAGFLEARAPGWAPPVLPRYALTQVHCHQHAVLGFGAEERLLRRMGVTNETLDSGCCGLAGNFGFERGHYDVSMACAERVLLPAVRQAPPHTLVLADGFSCRTQIAHGTGRQAMHLAEVLAMALFLRRTRMLPGTHGTSGGLDPGQWDVAQWLW